MDRKEISKRMDVYFTSIDYNRRKAAEVMKMQVGSWNNIFANANTNITLEKVSLFLEIFPDVSAEWLMRGKGEMTLNGSFTSRLEHLEAKVKEIEDKLSKKD